MRRWPAPQFVCAVALVTVAGACAGPVPTPSPTSPAHIGGTLRIGFADAPDYVRDLVYADPGRPNPGFFMRCCLARTLVTYPGETTIDGGTVLTPDLAEAMPEVSRDGLTWTFHIRRGMKYAPPNDGIEVTSADFVTAVERSIRINGEVFPPFLFVAGTQEYLDGSAPSVAGLETPDPNTLVVRLVRPFGALDYLADPVWAPIPASVAVGHDDDLGLFWPSTGPYMYETYPADPTPTAQAFVRNPSWSKESDGRRQANLNRIEFSIADGNASEVLSLVDRSEYDFLNTRLDSEATSRYRSDPSAAPRLRSTPGEYLYRLPMNIAVPPFDDLAVRRAVNYAIDRIAVRDATVLALNANGTAQPPTLLSEHMFADSITGGLLIGYDPFSIGDGRGNFSRARTEMSRSRYDADANGVCDADVCAAIDLPTFDMAAGDAVAQSLEAIGLTVRPVALTDSNDISFVTNRTGVAVLPFGWGFDLTGSELAFLVKGGETLSPDDGFVVNTSLVGARAQDLQRWGYAVTSVPSVDDVIDRCDREVGNRRARCWAELDQQVAETIAPWVPLFAFESVWVSSPRVERYTLDQATFAQFPALDRVSLVPGSD